MKEQTGQLTHRLHVKMTAFLLIFTMATIAVAAAMFFVWPSMKVNAGSSSAAVTKMAASVGNSTAVKTGQCGADITYTLYDDGLLELTGSGAMYDMGKPEYGKFDDLAEMQYYIRPWENNSQNIKKIVFYGAITSIGKTAFHDCSNLTSVTIPDSFTSINEFAFFNCTGLTDITLPDTVTSIDKYAFWGCNRLTSINIPDSVTLIDKYAFDHCSSLSIVTIPKSVTKIGDYAFDICSKLTDIYYQGSEQDWQKISIGSNNAPLTGTNMHFNSGMVKTGQCGDNISYTLYDDGLLVLNGSGAMYDYSSDSSPWYANKNSIKKIAVKGAITSIGSHAFENCSSLTSITLLNSVTSIGSSAFYHCSKLTDVYFDGSEEDWQNISIGSNNVPLTGANIGFHGGIIKTGRCGDNITYTLYDDGLLVLNGSGAMYNYSSNSSPWYSKKNSIKKIAVKGTITSIGSLAFKNCSSVTSVTLPNSVTSIEHDAFAYCNKFTSINIPDSVTSIGYKAFDHCSGLTSITIPDSVTSIGSSAFSGSSSLKDIYYSGTESQWNKLNPNKLSLNANVTVHFGKTETPLKITAQPSDVTVKAGDSVTFAVEAQGDGLTYQWYYKKAGQTAWNKWGTRTTAGTTATANATWNGMQVYCKVTDQYGNYVDSNPSTITIQQDLKIITQPTDKTIKLGESLTLSVKAEGIGLTYQWYFKKAGQTSFSKWNGRTHASESVTPNATWDGIQLYCTVKDSSGNSLDSSTVKITVTQALKITSQPTDKTIKLGDSVTLSLKAQGSGLTYQWYFKKDGQTSFNIWKGHTKSTESCMPNATWNGIQLYCIVKDSEGNSVQSDTITVKINSAGITITQQPQNHNIIAGKSLTLTVKATGNSLKYQWYFKKKGQTSFSVWNGRTHASETVSPNNTWDGIQLYCKITDGSGNTFNSSTVTVSVLSITTQPSNVTVAAGNNATFTVKATGSGLKYQWYYMKGNATTWSVWKGRTTASTTATANSTWNGMKVYCKVTDSAGNSFNSNAAIITLK